MKKGDIEVNSITRPGALVGEIGLLLDALHGATVEATRPSILRVAEDGRAFLASDPAITRLVAIGLAERLNVVTTYLADLKHQYGDAPGLTMVSRRAASARRPPGARARGPARRAIPSPSTDRARGDQNTERAGAEAAERSMLSMPS